MTYGQDPSAFDAGYHQNYGNYANAAPGPQPLPPGKFDAIRSLEQGWRIFAEKPGGWIGSAAVYMGIFFVGYLASYFSLIFIFTSRIDEETGEFDGSNMSWGIIAALAAVLVISIIAALIWELVTVREAVYAVGGKKPEFKDFFTFRRCGVLFLMLIVVGLLATLGMFALIIGMFVVAFFFMFAMFAIVFEDMSIGSALKTSYTVAKENVGQTLLLWLLTSIINGIGGSFIFGVLLTGPLCYIAIAHAYMTATGRPVSERRARS
ncbi:hypothetical protein [Corynebacterium sp. H130]|uniref:hypothetical protein n=1 Tax=Corynebacterium sp. H130 TaxID=3133444 RepID=UPI0030B246FD